MIGMFDSGSGGLTVLQAIRERVPNASILYYGDIKHVPYGSKTRPELTRLTLDAIEFLQQQGATAIISACNSASASLAISIFETLSITPKDLIEMVGPTVRALKDSEERICLLATPATVASEMYQNAFRMVGKEIEVRAVEDVAGLIEFGAPEDVLEDAIRTACTPLPDADVVVLACTHYPLVMPLFQKVLGNVRIFDPAQAVAERAEHQFAPHASGDGSIRFCITKDSESFRALVASLFSGVRYSIEVV